MRALNAFIHDIYHDQQILKAGVIPAEQVLCNSQYRPEMQGVDVPGGIYAHIAGIDIVRDDAGEFRVLEDNLRVPSGVSYMLENRKMMMRLFPELFSQLPHRAGRPLSRRAARQPAQRRAHRGRRSDGGAADRRRPQQRLLRARLPRAADGHRTGRGPGPVRARRGGVHAHHPGTAARRCDLPAHRRRLPRSLVFRPDSMLGVPGLLTAYRAGRVTIANAIGTGVADDKSIYPYVPDMIRFYLGQAPIIGNVHTWMLRRADDLDYVLAHLPELVVKEVHGAGGYGMLIGPAATKAEIEMFRRQIIATPERYIAQPTLALSTCPTFADQRPRAAPHRPAARSCCRAATSPSCPAG